MENKTIYHSAFGGDLVFEPNDKYLEHALKNPGNYGLKNTGRDKYSGLYKAADEARQRRESTIRRIRDMLRQAVDRFSDNAKESIVGQSDDKLLKMSSDNDEVVIKMTIGDKEIAIIHSGIGSDYLERYTK